MILDSTDIAIALRAKPAHGRLPSLRTVVLGILLLAAGAAVLFLGEGSP